MPIRFLFTVLALTLCPLAGLFAQQACDSRGGYGCEQRGAVQPCPSCAAGRPCIVKHVYVPAPPCEQPQPEAGVPEGGFAAPPRVGVFAGETSAVGIEGLSIEFPAIRLRFPSVRLPALTRYRTHPRMIIEQAEAPFVTDFREERSFEAGPVERPLPEAGIPPRPPVCPEAAPLPCPPCDARHCAQCARSHHMAAGYTQPHAPPREGHSYVPPTQAGHPAAHAVAHDPWANHAYHARLQQLHDAERRIDAKMEQLQHSIDRLADLQQRAAYAPAQPAAPPVPLQQVPVARLHPPQADSPYAAQPASHFVPLGYSAPSELPPAGVPSRLPKTGS